MTASESVSLRNEIYLGLHNYVENEVDAMDYQLIEELQTITFLES